MRILVRARAACDGLHFHSSPRPPGLHDSNSENGVGHRLRTKSRNKSLAANIAAHRRLPSPFFIRVCQFPPRMLLAWTERAPLMYFPHHTKTEQITLRDIVPPPVMYETGSSRRASPNSICPADLSCANGSKHASLRYLPT